MRRLVPLVAALAILPGCVPLWGLAATSEAPGAKASVRSAVLAAEAYHADHGSYAGLTLEALHEYDPSIRGVTVALVSPESYCLEAADGTDLYSSVPGGGVVSGPCRSLEAPPPAPAPLLPEHRYPEAEVLASVPAVEAWFADHGTYEGMTARRLRERYDAGLPDVRVVAADAAGYCVESRAADRVYSLRGPGGKPRPEPCGD